jgi:hypothetical protein
METRFTLDYRSSEAAASARALNRELHDAARWNYALVATLPPVLLLGAALAGMYLAWWGDSYSTAVIGAAAVAFPWTRLVSPSLRRKLLKPSGGVLEGRVVDYEFSEDGCRIRTEHFERSQKWAGVDRIIEESGMVLIVIGPNADFLPKRMFVSAAQRRDFVVQADFRLMPAARRRSVIR